ncbi:MAG: hypothetical protein DLM72_05775 [Candidatus Nitrosopolaris wilkensis]|nr:MAG: hypothetical protein DLM72_05775 [Candidatus Nitrosopolaris wilkensis]
MSKGAVSPKPDCSFWKIKDKVKESASRHRAREIYLKKLNRYSVCEINDANCYGKLNVHHFEKDPFNNTENNLVCLCRTHHRIADNYNLGMSELRNITVMSKYERTYTQFSKSKGNVKGDVEKTLLL